MKKENILIVNICKEKLHYYEFVKPIKDILINNGVKYFVRAYKEINKSDLKKASKIIICGTSLYDNDFIGYYHKFNWLKNFNKPVLGICGGMETIGLVFGGKLKKNTEIGFYKECFNKSFLGLLNEQEVYHLHNYHLAFNKEFKIYCFSDGRFSKVSQAVRHKEKPIYGVLFHPEVRQKNLIKEFCEVSN